MPNPLVSWGIPSLFPSFSLFSSLRNKRKRTQFEADEDQPPPLPHPAHRTPIEHEHALVPFASPAATASVAGGDGPSAPAGERALVEYVAQGGEPVAPTTEELEAYAHHFHLEQDAFAPGRELDGTEEPELAHLPETPAALSGALVAQPAALSGGLLVQPAMLPGGLEALANAAEARHLQLQLLAQPQAPHPLAALPQPPLGSIPVPLDPARPRSPSLVASPHTTEQIRARRSELVRTSLVAQGLPDEEWLCAEEVKHAMKYHAFTHGFEVRREGSMPHGSPKAGAKLRFVCCTSKAASIATKRKSARSVNGGEASVCCFNVVVEAGKEGYAICSGNFTHTHDLGEPHSKAVAWQLTQHGRRLPPHLAKIALALKAAGHPIKSVAKHMESLARSERLQVVWGYQDVYNACRNTPRRP
jgi:hypothetical protein